MADNDEDFYPVPVLPKTIEPHEEVRKISEYNPTQEDLKRIIRDMHLKVTSQRLLILQALSEGSRHVTAQELFEKVSGVDSAIGFATVYRFLRSLTEGQFVTEMRMGGLPARYELTPKSHHDHLTCTECGKICEFENRAIEDLQLKVAQQFGFVLTHQILELYGVCSACAQKNAQARQKNGTNAHKTEDIGKSEGEKSRLQNGRTESASSAPIKRFFPKPR